MRKMGMWRGAAAFAALSAMMSAAFAQDQTQVVIDRGMTDDLPYTAIYPNVLKAVDDGNDTTILTLQHPNAPLQCDIFAVSGGPADWTADSALKNLDLAGIQQTWGPDFPGFKVVGQTVTPFSSGPALRYDGESDNSPLGVPLHIVHAEAVDGGRTYAVECLVQKDQADAAKPLVDFLIANFSTRSDGQCCIDPNDDRG